VSAPALQPREAVDWGRDHPDARSFRHKFGLIVPATNTSMEHELWSLVFRNEAALRGVGLHTTNVVTPRPMLETEADLRAYRNQFLGGLRDAVQVAMLAQPDSMIMGMSLEHILEGLDAVRAPVAKVAAWSGLAWATWHDAIAAALGKFNARRIGLLTPFDRTGTASAQRMFEDLGFAVAASYGFACASAVDIAHVTDAAKEQAILDLARAGNGLDAIVQCGTNMSLIAVAEKLEPAIGIPILGINAVTFWYALRQSGLAGPLVGGGRVMKEF
jgi:maleate isomerase